MYRDWMLLFLLEISFSPVSLNRPGNESPYASRRYVIRREECGRTYFFPVKN